MVTPTLMAGVSSGGVYPAAGVTCAATGTTPANAAVIAAPHRRLTITELLNTLPLLRKPHQASQTLQAMDFARVTGMFPPCKQAAEAVRAALDRLKHRKPS